MGGVDNERINDVRMMSRKRMRQLREDALFRAVADAPRPDHSLLKREARRFAEWIARQRAKEGVVCASECR